MGVKGWTVSTEEFYEWVRKEASERDRSKLWLGEGEGKESGYGGMYFGNSVEQ